VLWRPVIDVLVTAPLLGRLRRRSTTALRSCRSGAAIEVESKELCHSSTAAQQSQYRRATIEDLPATVFSNHCHMMMLWHIILWYFHAVSTLIKLRISIINCKSKNNPEVSNSMHNG
jgi:hypothetical protein